MNPSEINPNSVSVINGNIYGLPHNHDNAKIILIPSPIDITVSYGDGTKNGPEQILEASYQIDLFEPNNPSLYKEGIFMLPIEEEIFNTNLEFRKIADQLISKMELGVILDEEDLDQQKKLNEYCNAYRQKLKEKTIFELENGKKVGMIGGDHSSTLGIVQGFAEHYDAFGILQIDAHADLREAYEGFEFSHASVMHEVIKTPQVKKLVQVGIRDICEEEIQCIKKHPNTINTFFDRHLKQSAFKGKSWHDQCVTIVECLPEFVYVSFDIDGLDPKLCPNTGTPVPGGLQYEEALYLIEMVKSTGRKIIGFDVVEVSNGTLNDWDANVGMRLIYRLCSLL